MRLAAENRNSTGRYLIRFDDICPTMNWEIFNQIERILDSYQIKPIIAVVPDNLDTGLMVAPAKLDFWEWVRSRQRLGWTVALHGYQHTYVNESSGIMRLTPHSEFAGLSYTEQKRKLTAGLMLFDKEGIKCDAWVAPSHSFDWTTVEVLAELGIKVISDGLWAWPRTDRSGVTWVPQQMWSRFRPKQKGVWTVCYHHNGWSASEVDRFAKDICEYVGFITNLPTVVDTYAGRQITLSDHLTSLYELLLNHRIRPFASRLLRSSRL